MRDFVKTKGNDLIVEEAPIIGNLLARCFSKITEKSNEEKRSSRSAPKYSPLNDRLVHGQLKLESSLQKKDRCIGDNFVIQAILTHVFVCQRYEEGSAMFNGEIKTTIFLIKWSGYDFDDLSWEPQFSLATDALGMILNYFINYVAVFGPLYYGPKSEERTTLSSMEFFRSAAGKRSTPQSVPKTVLIEDNRIIAPLCIRLFASIQKLDIYDDVNGFRK